MRNYLTGKERLLVAALALILPFSFAKAEAREDGKTGQQADVSFFYLLHNHLFKKSMPQRATLVKRMIKHFLI